MSNETIEMKAAADSVLTNTDRYFINRKKRSLFSNLPRWKRSNLRVRLEGKIRRENLRWGHRLFYTRDYIEPEARCCWCDFWFPSSKDKFTVYSAYLHSCQETLTDLAEEALEPELNSLFEKYIGNSWTWKVAERDAWGKPLTYTDADSDRYSRTWPELDNLSYYDYREKRISEWLQENKPPVYEQYTVDVNEGHYGLFLVMSVDEDLVTADVINKRIEHFYSLGEPLEWRADAPVPQERLLYSQDWRSQKNLSLGNALLDVPKGI